MTFRSSLDEALDGEFLGQGQGFEIPRRSFSEFEEHKPINAIFPINAISVFFSLGIDC